MNHKFSITFFMLLLFINSCSDETTSPTDDLQPTWSDIYTKVIAKKCALSGCHINGHPTLDMSSKMVAYDNLINIPSSQGFDYIEPTSADSSYLYLKIILDGGGRSGLRMPRNGPPFLSDNEISIIGEWITGGALNN